MTVIRMEYVLEGTLAIIQTTIVQVGGLKDTSCLNESITGIEFTPPFRIIRNWYYDKKSITVTGILMIQKQKK